MTGIESGAYELRHNGRIHRASDFSQLLQWVKEYRVTGDDSFRPAGTDEWLSILSRREFASLLNPENQWTVTMKSGIFRAPDFDTIVVWAKDGRITDDAVIEGPRTPPGGVKAAALPAVSPHLKEACQPEQKYPYLSIDGREYRAPDTETIRGWIRDSRVPLESRISLDGENWEPVSSCGLFDLEDWPAAAHGRIEEDILPEMPENTRLPLSEVPKPGHEEPVEELKKQDQKIPGAEIDNDGASGNDDGGVPFTVTTTETEITVESVSELKRLLKKRVIFSYDEISHPTIETDSISVGEYLEGLRKKADRKKIWIWAGLAAVVTAAVAMELTHVVELVPWF